MAKINQKIGNSPVKTIPSDYYPEGCGFWFELSDGLDAGKKMFFKDSTHGDGTPESTIVFIHGNPENSYTYRLVIEDLIKNAKKPIRIVAMDHIGFGLSDQATFEMVCMDHANNLLQLVEHLDLKNVTLVIHDWGGPIGIGAFLKVPERVSNLVILNTTVFPFPKTGITYKNWAKEFKWARSPRVIPNKVWGAFAAYIIFIHQIDDFDPLVLLENLKKTGRIVENENPAQITFREQFQSDMNVRSSKRLVLQTPVWGHGNVYKEPNLGERDTTPFYRDIQDNISNLWGEKGQNIGVRAVLGRIDPSAKEEINQQWIEHLPQLEENIKIFDGYDVGHFIEEIHPEAVAEAIIDVANLK
jgi:pimeloyl-ACP methyl ester carboxylesterase